MASKLSNIISGDGTQLRLDIHLENSTSESVWSSPPAVLGRLLQEVFSAQPQDVLSWLHTAVWEHRTEELRRPSCGSKQADLELGFAASERFRHDPSLGSIPEERVSLYRRLEERTTVSRPPEERPSQGSSLVQNCSNTSLLPHKRSSLKDAASQEASCSPSSSCARKVSWRFPEALRPRSKLSNPETPEDACEEGSPRQPNASRESQLLWNDGPPRDAPLVRAKPALSREPSGNSLYDELPKDVAPVWKKRASDLSYLAEAPTLSVDSHGYPGFVEASSIFAVSKDQACTDSIATMYSIASEAYQINQESAMESTLPSLPQRGSSTVRSSLQSGHTGSSGGSQLSRLGNFLEHFTTRKQDSLRRISTMSNSQFFWKDSQIVELLDMDVRDDGCLLSPVGLVRCIWEVLFFLCLVYEIWATPFEFMFLPEDVLAPPGLRVAASIVVICFCVDIALNFFTGFVEDGEIVMERRRIVHNYLTGWFWVDMLATLPALVFDHVFRFADQLSLLRASRVFRVLRMLKALRLLRVSRLFRTQRLAYCMMPHFGNSSRVKNCWRLMVLQVVFAIVAHLHAVAWAAMQPTSWQASSADEAYVRYVAALSWAYETLACGSSGFLPVNISQQVLMIIVSIERVSAVPMVIALAVWRVIVQRHEGAELAATQEGAIAYLKRHRVPVHVRMQVFRNLQETGEVQNLQRQFDKLSKESFPAHLRQSICEKLWSVQLMSIGLVQHLGCWHADFVPLLSQTVREEIFASKVIVFSSQELSTAAYLLRSGSLAVASNQLKGALKTDYTVGMWIGEKALVNMTLPRFETVVTRVRSELMKVSAKEFHELVSRLGLIDAFQELLRKKLWLGLCGRCGVLGDHFPSECPRAPARQSSSGLSEYFPPFPFTRRCEASFRKSLLDTSNNADITRFLNEQNLMRLQPAMERYKVHSMDDLTLVLINALRDDPQVKLTESEAQVLSDASIEDFKRRIEKANTVILDNHEDHHLMFISHYKVEAGTEAALMTEDLERLIQEDSNIPGHGLKAPVFLDTENLRDLRDLQNHVRRSHNLVLLLSSGVLTRPWVLIELVTAMKDGVQVVPVEIQRPGMAFQYPDEDFYKRLRHGLLLGRDAEKLLKSEGISLKQLEHALRQVFAKIAVPFSPHKTANIRQAELLDLLTNCRRRNMYADLERSRGLRPKVNAQTEKKLNVSAASSFRPSYLAAEESLSVSITASTMSPRGVSDISLAQCTKHSGAKHSDVYPTAERKARATCTTDPSNDHTSASRSSAARNGDRAARRGEILKL